MTRFYQVCLNSEQNLDQQKSYIPWFPEQEQRKKITNYKFK